MRTVTVAFLGYVPYDPTAPLRQRRRQREVQGLTMR